MRKDSFYGVQFAQSLYDQLWKCSRFLEIYERVFIHSNEVSVKMGGFYKGAEQVKKFFDDIAKRTEENGGLLRLDIPTTQYIEEGIDEEHVIGHWTTVSFEFDNPAPGNNIYCTIGKYKNEFVLENNVWKMKSLCYEHFYKLGPWKTTEDQNMGLYLKNPKEWIKVLPELSALNQLDASAKTMEILNLRNILLKAAGIFNQTGELIMGKEHCKSFLANVRTLLVTSPVIKMSDAMDDADAFFSVSALAEDGAKMYKNTRGSLGLKLSKCGDEWKIKDLKWYNYATLSPWPLCE